MNEFIFILDSGLVWALIASLGGCLTRQLTELKAGRGLRLAYVSADLFIALFLGFYTFWYVIEEIKPSLIHACLINIIVGYTGSKVIEIAKGILARQAKAYFSIGDDK